MQRISLRGLLFSNKWVNADAFSQAWAEHIPQPTMSTRKPNPRQLGSTSRYICRGAQGRCTCFHQLQVSSRSQVLMHRCQFSRALSSWLYLDVLIAVAWWMQNFGSCEFEIPNKLPKHYAKQGALEYIFELGYFKLFPVPFWAFRNSVIHRFLLRLGGARRTAPREPCCYPLGWMILIINLRLSPFSRKLLRRVFPKELLPNSTCHFFTQRLLLYVAFIIHHLHHFHILSPSTSSTSTSHHLHH